MERINIIVKTNSGKSEFLEYDAEKQAYRVNVKSLPEGGKANLEVEKLARKHFRKDAKIVLGFKSKKKVLEISRLPLIAKLIA